MVAVNGAETEAGGRIHAEALRSSLVGLACRLGGPAVTVLGRVTGGRATWPPRRVLVIKPCCFGDLLMATPVLAALRSAFPALDLALLTSTWARPAVASNPRLSRIILSDPLGVSTISPGFFARLGHRLRGEHFDWVLVLDRSPLLATLAALCGAPVRAGLDSEGRGLGLTHRVAVAPERHEADLYLDVLHSLDVPATRTTPEYMLETRAVERVAGLVDSLGATRPLVLLHPGGGQNPGTVLLAKRWPAERYAALASRLIARAGAMVVVVGAAADQPASSAVVGGLRLGRACHDLTGQLALDELAALCARADLYVGNDSGPLHLAAAVGTPTLGLFGPTSPARYGPRGRQARSLRAAVDCRGCWRSGPFPDCSGRCMAALTVDAVWEAASELLQLRAPALR